ncbi:MAG: hypothetical protein WCP85_00010 [Mariniphaga sp.]
MLKIEKTKILYFPYENLKGYRNLTKVKGGIFRKMNDTVEIADDVTFGDFFKFLIKEKELVNIIFMASLYGVPFDLLIKDFNRKDKIDDPEIHVLEIYWDVDFDPDGIVIEADMQCFGRWNGNEDTDHSGLIGLDFTPINELTNSPLKLNEHFEIYNSKIKHNKENLIISTTRKFTLYEIIHAILFELSWYGTPETRDKEGKTILEEVRKIKTLDDVFESEVNMRALRNKAVSKMDKFLPITTTEDQV